VLFSVQNFSKFNQNKVMQNPAIKTGVVIGMIAQTFLTKSLDLP
jgi:hypothetical protein